MASDLIFDFFGTLVDFSDAVFPGERYSRTHQVLLDHGFSLDYSSMVSCFEGAYQSLEDETRLSLAEFHMFDVGRRFFVDSLGGAPGEEVIAQFIAAFMEEWNRQTIYFAEIGAFLGRLSGKHRLSIISNTHYPPVIHSNLQAMNVSHHFAQVVTSAEIGARKPDSRIFREALAGLGIEPGDAIFVGDSYDAHYKGAVDSGVPCVLVDPRREWLGRVPYRIDHLFDLETVLADPGFHSNPDR